MQLGKKLVELSTPQENTLWAPNASDNKGNGGIAHTLVSGGGAAAAGSI